MILIISGKFLFLDNLWSFSGPFLAQVSSINPNVRATIGNSTISKIEQYYS